VDWLILAPEQVTNLLKASSKTTAVETLVRVKSHYLEVEVAKVEGDPNQEADLKVIEAEVEATADKVVEDINFEGDGEE
jgi:phosphoglycerate-specific signal transduction histidine kinase